MSACAWLASLYAVEVDSRTMRWAFVGFLLGLAAYNLLRMLMTLLYVLMLVLESGGL